MAASVVKQTMVMLSDAVTTMMLLVVPLQESNAPMNQELPQRTQAVAHIAAKISAVADGLAQDEYDAFPDIQKEMLDASSDVREQVGGLNEAIQELKGGSNRKRGWEILVSSCASISTKTVLLLKIVYGVEIKRVMASAKNAMAKVNAIDVDELETDPQEFVRKLSEAATELDQLGEYMAAKANDPDLSPEVQEQMRRAAEYQKQASENLIKAGNDFIQDRKNPNKKRALGDAIEDARNAINAGNRPMGSLDEQLQNLLADQQPKQKRGEEKTRGVEYDPQDMAYNIARAKQILDQLADPNNTEDPEKLLKELEALYEKIKKDAEAAGDMMDPQQQKAIAQLLEAMAREIPLLRKQIRDGKDISDSLNRLLNGLDQLGQMCAPYASQEQVAADLMKNDLEKLEEAVDKGDGDGAKRSVANVVENQKKLEAAPFGDDNTGQHQRENVAGLSKDVPADIHSLRECLADAKNPEKKGDFKKANEVVKADARQVGAYAAPSGAADLDELLDELRGGVREAVEASKDNDPKRLQEQSAVVNGARSKMQPVVARSAQANTDPVRRRNEIGKWKDLNDCLDDFMKAVKGGDDIEVEKKKEKVLDAIEDYRDAASVDPLAAAEDLRRSAADFVAASVKDDRKKIPEKAKDTQHAVAALHAPAQKAALRTGDPEINERVLGDLDKLDQLVKELVELGAQNVDANNNRDAPTALRTAKQMNKKYDDVDNTIDDLTSALKPGVGKKHPDGPQSVEHDIPPHLRQLYAAAKELERKLPAVIASAEDAERNPEQKEKDAFAKALEDLEMPLRGIKPADSDEDKVVALSHVLQDHIEDMADAAKKGEPEGVVCGARLGSDTKAKLGPLLEELAAKEENPKKAAKIRDLAQQLENEFPKTIVAARKALQNPNDKQAQEELERAQDKVDDILESIRSTAGKTPEESCMATSDDLKKSMAAVLGFVNAGKKRDAVQEARRAAATNLNPLKKHVEGLENEDDLLSALDRLYDLLKDMEEQTPKAADAPAGSQPRKDLQDIVDEASKLLDKIVDESGAEALAAIQGEKRDLKDLHDDINKEDPNALKADIKEVVASHRDVLDKLRNEQPKLMHASPNRAKELGDAIEEMESLIPQVIQKTKGAIVNPDNHAAQRELDEAISTLEVPLAKSANAVAPSALRDLKAKAKEVDRAGRAVAAGTMTGDVAKAQKNSDQLNDLKPLKDAVEERLRQIEKNDPVHAKELEKRMAEVEEAAKEVQRSAKDPSKVGEASDKLSHKLRELEEAAEASDIPQDVALAAAQKDDLLRALKGPLSAANKLNMNDLLKMAMDLSDSMGGMIGKVEDDVRRQGGGGGVLDAIKLLKDLERKASEPIKAPKLEEKKPEPKEKKATTQRPLPAPIAANADFSDKVKHMAEVIDVTADAAQDEKLSSTAQGLSATLIRLAEAAKSGDRMGILKQTKDAVADINRLVLVFKEIAEEITDRKMKDRMVWLSSMLKDVATNLKILCSVKAASGGPDNDDQIVSVITSVKNIFTEGLDVANIAEKTNKRRRKA